ncbi:WSC domain protein [Basidiobolus ranarum]|uniref:WSC domain protein n=1 Tax=Basidiobolus ranarum TaxID=34480 RepID=A0ABR2WB92_9FUNG
MLQPKVIFIILYLLFPKLAQCSVYVGCYDDADDTPLLNDLSSIDLPNPFVDPLQSNELCAEFCQTHQFIYSGTHDGKFCYCGNTIPPRSSKVPEYKCYIPCVGNEEDVCGGNEFTSVYAVGSNHPDSSPLLGHSPKTDETIDEPELKTQFSSNHLNNTSTWTSKPSGFNGSVSNGVGGVPPGSGSFIDNTGLMAAVFTLAGVVLIGSAILAFILYHRKKHTLEPEYPCSVSSDSWEHRRSSISLRDHVDYTRKLRVTNPDC